MGEILFLGIGLTLALGLAAWATGEPDLLWGPLSVGVALLLLAGS